MSFKRLFFIVLFSIYLVGCAANPGAGNSYMSFVREDNQKMGVRYLLGRGVKQNDEQAFYYFSQAARQGDALSQNEIAYLYAAGKGTERNYAQSFYWYQQAAAQGLASAQYNLGFMYQHGLGTQANQAKAKEWYQKAAAHGFKPAVVALKKD